MHHTLFIGVFLLAVFVPSSAGQPQCTCGMVVPANGSCTLGSAGLTCSTLRAVTLMSGATLDCAGQSITYTGMGKTATAIVANTTGGGVVTIRNYCHVNHWPYGMNATGKGTVRMTGTNFENCDVGIWANNGVTINLSQNGLFNNNTQDIRFEYASLNISGTSFQGSPLGISSYIAQDGGSFQLSHGTLTNTPMYLTDTPVIIDSYLHNCAFTWLLGAAVHNTTVENCTVHGQNYNGQTPGWDFVYTNIVNSHISVDTEDGILRLAHSQVSGGSVQYTSNFEGEVFIEDTRIVNAPLTCVLHLSAAYIQKSNFTNSNVLVSTLGFGRSGYLNGLRAFNTNFTLYSAAFANSIIETGRITQSCPSTRNYAGAACNATNVQLDGGVWIINMTGGSALLRGIAITNQNALLPGLQINGAGGATRSTVNVTNISVAGGYLKIDKGISGRWNGVSLHQQGPSVPKYSLVLSNYTASMNDVQCDNSASGCCIKADRVSGSITGLKTNGACVCCTSMGGNNVTITTTTGSKVNCTKKC